MGERKLERRARILALQALYAEEQQLAPKVTKNSFLENNLKLGFFSDVLEFSWLDREVRQEELFMAKTLVQGVRHNKEEIDGFIIQHLQNWTIDRMLAVDRTILRLGVYMLKYLVDISDKIIINECIELCHSFSSEQSYRLINGVLHTLARKLRPNYID